MSNPKSKEQVLDKLQDLPKPSKWQRIRIFFKDSEVIVLARIQLLAGFAIAAVAAMDWSPLVSIGASPNFTKDQLISLGSILLIQGIVTEIARRHREPEMNK